MLTVIPMQGAGKSVHKGQLDELLHVLEATVYNSSRHRHSGKQAQQSHKCGKILCFTEGVWSGWR